MDLFIKDRKIALALNLLTPIALKLLPKLMPKRSPEKSLETPPVIPIKAKIYGSLRRGISALRSKLKKNKKEPALTPETTEN